LPEAAPPILPATAANAYKAFRALGDEAAAEGWLARALALAPANATLQRDQGVLHQKRGDWVRAAACFEAAVALRGDVAAYRGNLATALFHCARYAQAAEHYRAGLALDPAQPLWWRRLARALVHLNEPGEAAQAYTRALELQEDAATRGALEELLRQMRSGSRAASSAYYDAVFADSPKYAQGGEASEYAPAWQAIADLLRGSGSRRILDLGCGPGQFAEYLAGQLPAIEYTGIDFSGVAVSRARQRCPNFLFEKRELPIAQFNGLPPFDTAVCTEVLEHVEADREILAALPPGTRIVASVPNYDAFGHLRTFEDADSVRRRYGQLFDDLRIQAAPLSAQRTLWLLDGRRSSAALPAEEPDAAVLGSVDLAATAVDCVLWTDGTRYAQDFLPQFGLPFVTVADAVGLAEPHVALRHDVDWSIENAYAMAVVEHQLGIRSSYYLLHPDGNVTSRNYFGQVADGRLAIDPRLFDWAARLIDLGHEVGLHNDLISLALATRRQPAEFLEQIVEAFAGRGMPLAGSVAHGSRQCREMGYLNYQIFADFKDEAVALDYRDQPELFERFREGRVEHDGHVVHKFALRMADYGLRYEANFVAREIYLSDSSARWTLWHDADPVRLEKFARRERMQASLADAPPRKQAGSGAARKSVV
ncbi:MAG TPA: methyltransferase domain-containing protein, partial [Burkholderiaceae bacterium]|nr:methyltransferase domain-containing protein [Burkholderiaceae bacterium]